MASLTIEATTHIDLPPDAVYAYATDPAKMNRWVSNVLEAAWVGAGGYEPGAQYAIRYRWRGTEQELVHEVVSAEPGRWFEFKAIAGPYPIRGRYEFILEDRGTRFTYRREALPDSPATSLMFRLFGWFLRRTMARQLKKEVEALAAAAKLEGPPTPPAV